MNSWTRGSLPQEYASPLVLRVVPLSAGSLMRLAGVIEIVAGAAILFGITRLGGYVVTLWLALIALTRLSEVRESGAVPSSVRSGGLSTSSV